jgi:hypothetical protein
MEEDGFVHIGHACWKALASMKRARQEFLARAVAGLGPAREANGAERERSHSNVSGQADLVTAQAPSRSGLEGWAHPGGVGCAHQVASLDVGRREEAGGKGDHAAAFSTEAGRSTTTRR